GRQSSHGSACTGKAQKRPTRNSFRTVHCHYSPLSKDMEQQDVQPIKYRLFALGETRYGSGFVAKTMESRSSRQAMSWQMRRGARPIVQL
ncbi:MAG: hypothetical protein WAU10_25630, partial [Caldilineaceae bacterium]